MPKRLDIENLNFFYEPQISHNFRQFEIVWKNFHTISGYTVKIMRMLPAYDSFGKLRKNYENKILIFWRFLRSWVYFTFLF